MMMKGIIPGNQIIKGGKMVYVKTKDGIVKLEELAMEVERKRMEKKRRKKVEKLPTWKEKYKISRWADRTIERFCL